MIAIVAIRPIYHLDFMITTDLSPDAVLRRIQDYAERGGKELHFMFLDWEKAFARIKQPMLLRAMRQYQIPEQLCSMVEALYQKPTFKVKDTKGESEWNV